MNTTTSTLLAGSIVIMGRWAQDKPINSRIVIGIMGTAIMLSLINEADNGLARAFGGLVLVTAVFAYAPDILKKTGLTK